LEAEAHKARGEILSHLPDLLHGDVVVVAPGAVRIVAARAKARIVGVQRRRPDEVIVQGGHALRGALHDLVDRHGIAVGVALRAVHLRVECGHDSVCCGGEGGGQLCGCGLGNTDLPKLRPIFLLCGKKRGKSP